MDNMLLFTDFELDVQFVRIVRKYYYKFQHVALPLEPLTYIRRSFDMDICKVCFDGDKLYVRNWTKMIERKDNISPNGHIMLFSDDNTILEESYNKRLEKYTNRGFILTRHPYHDTIIEQMEKLALRVKKSEYNSCGNLLKYITDGTLDLEQFGDTTMTRFN
jgi:hypothetical protein